jgi:hypothetical protein
MAAKNEDDENKKVYPTKKVLFVDIHGVKSFPYRGRRKHFSYLKQILGNSTERHNDFLDWLSSNLSGNTNLA